MFLSSVQFSSVAQLGPIPRPHGPQHARPPYPSLTPGVYSDSCPLSQWCHPIYMLNIFLALPCCCCCCCWVTSVVSDSVRPHRWQPTRLPRPWDSPGKNTGVGCHFLLQCMQVKSESEVAQLCPILSNSMDYSLSGSSIHRFSRQEYWSGMPLPSPYDKATIIKTIWYCHRDRNFIIHYIGESMSFLFSHFPFSSKFHENP